MGNAEDNTDSESSSETNSEGAQSEDQELAGKFDSVDELENSYQELESKVGQKQATEKLGEKILEETGKSPDELQADNLSTGEILQQVVDGQSNEGASEEGDNSDNSDLEQEVQRLKFEREKDKFFQQNPEAKQFDDKIDMFKQLPEYEDKSVETIWNEEVKDFLEAGKEAVKENQQEKQRANLGIQGRTVPETDEVEKKKEEFEETGHFEEGKEVVKEKLFGDKGVFGS